MKSSNRSEQTLRTGSGIAPDDRDLIAAIDLGSNSFHMIVARNRDGDLKLLDRLREPVRLAAGLDPDRRIKPAAEARALACLERFGQRIRGIPAGAVRAVGTNALRRARNATEFLARAELALGRPVDVIAGIEEARLIYLGVAHALGGSGERRLVVDIGGGSTELIVGEGFRPRHLESLHVGCVSSSQRYFAGGITSRAWAKAEIGAHMALEPVAAGFRRLGWERTIGASGTIKAIGSVVREHGPDAEAITLDALYKIRDLLIKDGTADLGRFKSLSEDRVEVFPGGVVVLIAVFEALQLERMEVSDGALREGLLYDLVGRIQFEDVRQRSADALARRYHADAAQAARVEATALYCFDRVASAWQLEEPSLRQSLIWAAQLHEIGLDIAHSQYHKHGAYVLSQADLAGFSRQEQRLLATLVRAHRRKFPTGEFEQLPARWQSVARKLAVLLRLAVVLRRPRIDEALPALDLAVNEREFRIEFPAGWLTEHPLLQADLAEEADYLAAAGIKLKYG